MSAGRKKAISLFGVLPFHDKSSQGVVAYPSTGGQREAHKCIFQGRKTRGVTTNVYLRKTLGKTKGGSTNFENKRFRSCFLITGKVLAPNVLVTRDSNL